MVYAIVALSVIGLREIMPHGSDSIWISQNFVDFKRWEESGRLEEFHLQSPTQPYVNLSIHTAPASHPLETSQSQADAESNPAPPHTWVGCHLL